MTPRNPNTDGLTELFDSELTHLPDSSHCSSSQVAVDNLEYWIDNGEPADADYRLPSASSQNALVNEAILPNGLPVIDASKLPAAPPQDAILSAISHYVFNHALDYQGQFESILLTYFNTANLLYFYGRIPPMHIKLGATHSPRTVMGSFSERADHGMHCEIVIGHSSLIRKRYSKVYIANNDDGIAQEYKDTLLHEMVHAYCTLVLKAPEYGHRGHGIAFARECNRIGELMGWPEVCSVKCKKQDRHKPKCNYWPHNVKAIANGYHESVNTETDDGYEVGDFDTNDTFIDDSQPMPNTNGINLEKALDIANEVQDDQPGHKRLAYLLVLIGRLTRGDNFGQLYPATEVLFQEIQEKQITNDPVLPEPLTQPT